MAASEGREPLTGGTRDDNVDGSGVTKWNVAGGQIKRACNAAQVRPMHCDGRWIDVEGSYTTEPLTNEAKVESPAAAE